MTPEAFIAKWKTAELTERAASQSHFRDLCDMLGEQSPTDADPKGEWYAFEKGATKTSGGEGWADVWKRGHFGWEYKGKRKDLDAAFGQLQQYALALENPPLLVVCDLNRFRIRTNWTNTVSEVHEFALDDLRDPTTRQKLKWTLSDPERLRPKRTRQSVTEKAAAEFATLAQRLRARGHAPELVAHFVNRLIFCMFAEDVDLLPKKLFSKMLTSAASKPEQFQPRAEELFRAMKTGGEAAWETIDWFNGGLFDDDTALPLDKADIELAIRASELDWGEIDPSILGTLFERGLDPDNRSQLGAHYTDRDKIMLIVEPVIIRPLIAEWKETKHTIQDALAKEQKAKSPSAKTKAHGEALALFRGFLDRLRAFKVLDPACGSGNFLYLALLALKDLEHRVSIEAEALGFQREFPTIGPASVMGIELNPYAAELARVSVWIGEVQWMRRNGFGVSKNPILKALDTIECRDALLNPDGAEAPWPEADAIIGNPPFLGGKLLRHSLGDEYVARVFSAYVGRVPAEADLVAYWFRKAWEAINSGRSQRAGLVATNSIRGGASRRVLEVVSSDGCIFDAWSDEPWVIDGAAVRVSLVCFAQLGTPSVSLNGSPIDRINSDLTGGLDLTKAHRLRENENRSFQGVTKGGPFEVEGTVAREWLAAPANPNGRTNADVLRPIRSGSDFVRRPKDSWVVDFGSLSEEAAALYEAPFEFVLRIVYPSRLRRQRAEYRGQSWSFLRPRPALRSAIRPLRRYIATPKLARYRIFVWQHPQIVPDNLVIVVARDDDAAFGVLHSRFHEAWSLARGAWLGAGNDPTYTPTSTFETFPFPDGLTPNVPATTYAADPRAVRIADAAKRLNDLREAWLNPPDLIQHVPEVVPGFPDRLLPLNEKAAATLKKRTLTNLYNERPTWLANAHRDLDAAVAAAYGWPEDISEDDALARLLELNRARAEAERATPRTSPAEREVETDEIDETVL